MALLSGNVGYLYLRFPFPKGDKTSAARELLKTEPAETILSAAPYSKSGLRQTSQLLQASSWGK